VLLATLSLEKNTTHAALSFVCLIFFFFNNDLISFYFSFVCLNLLRIFNRNLKLDQLVEKYANSQKIYLISENNKQVEGSSAGKVISTAGKLTLSAGNLEYLSREKFNPTQSKIHKYRTLI
jgi:hypothetical protein